MFRSLLPALVLLPGLLAAQPVDRLPAYLLQVPESIAAVLIAETDASALHSFDNGTYASDQRYMSVGQKGVGKQRPWDKRTPLGIYFIQEHLDTTGLHERYGPAAFPLDYPNIWDRINKRSGDGIWIHGVTPNGGRRPPLDTDGCIALPNDELLSLAERLVPMVTPVIITRQIRWAAPEQVAADRAQLSAALEAWAASFRVGDMHGYLSSYADNFSYRGMNRDEWSAFRLQSIAARQLSQFELQDVLLLGHPEDSGLYLSRFRQTIVENDRTIATIKRLYWRRSADGALRIVAEDNG